MLFVVSTKRGFVSAGPVIITDHRRRPFYVKTANNGRPILFNLPPGKYNNEGAEIKPSNLVAYKTEILPPPERIIPVPEKIIFLIGPNPHKCSIDLNRGLILIDKKVFDKCTRPQLEFIFQHEKGHYLYKSEEKCDQYAAAQMIAAGYNPSQLFYSINGCLGPQSESRKQNIFNYSKKITK